MRGDSIVRRIVTTVNIIIAEAAVGGIEPVPM